MTAPKLDFEQLLASGFVMDALLDEFFATGGTQASLVEQLNAGYRADGGRMGWGDDNWPRLLRRIEDYSRCDASVLLQAIRCGDTQLLRHGLMRGAHIEQYEADEGPPLVEAARQLSVQRVRVSGSQSTPDKERRAKQQRDAARTSLRLLIEAGADVDITDRKGETALIKCAGALDPQGVHLLLSAGAKVNDRNGSGMTALHAALGHRAGELQSEELCRELLDVVVALLDGGADPNARTFERCTPLHVFAWAQPAMPAHTAREILGVLLRAGAQLESRTADGVTPLLMCVTGGQRNLVVAEALLNAGADPSATNWSGEGLDKIGDAEDRRPVLALLAARNIQQAMGGVDDAGSAEPSRSSGFIP